MQHPSTEQKQALFFNANLRLSTIRSTDAAWNRNRTTVTDHLSAFCFEFCGKEGMKNNNVQKTEYWRKNVNMCFPLFGRAAIIFYAFASVFFICCFLLLLLSPSFCILSFRIHSALPIFSGPPSVCPALFCIIKNIGKFETCFRTETGCRLLPSAATEKKYFTLVLHLFSVFSFYT